VHRKGTIFRYMPMVLLARVHASLLSPAVNGFLVYLKSLPSLLAIADRVMESLPVGAFDASRPTSPPPDTAEQFRAA
jgi:hypothetical protein